MSNKPKDTIIGCPECGAEWVDARFVEKSAIDEANRNLGLRDYLIESLQSLKAVNEINRCAAENSQRRIHELEARVAEFEVIKKQHLCVVNDAKWNYEGALSDCDHYKEERDELKREVERLSGALDKIDWHIRTLQSKKVLTMTQMIESLKVISDALKKSESEK